MNEQINTELARLQDQLQSLDRAVQHIKKAETVSNQAVNAAKQVQKEFGEQLKQVLFHYHEFLKKITAHTEDNINALSDSNLKQHAAIGNLMADYGHLKEETAALTQTIGSVDFPKRLDKIEDQIAQTNAEMQALQKAMHKSHENQNQEIAALKATVRTGLQKHEKYSDSLNAALKEFIAENNRELGDIVQEQGKQIKSLRGVVFALILMLVLFVAFVFADYFNLFG